MRSLGVAGVVLAAGASKRLGRPKQQERFQAETLVSRAVRLAQEAGLDPVYVVLPNEMTFDDLPARAVLLRNTEAAEGMASSVRLGVREAEKRSACGLVLLACDQPLLTCGHLRALCASPEVIVASAYAGRRGVPAYFPASVFPRLLELRGDTGARELLQQAEAIRNEDLALDVDTNEDLQRLRATLTATQRES